MNAKSELLGLTLGDSRAKRRQLEETHERAIKKHQPNINTGRETLEFLWAAICDSDLNPELCQEAQDILATKEVL